MKVILQIVHKDILKYLYEHFLKDIALLELQKFKGSRCFQQIRPLYQGILSQRFHTKTICYTRQNLNCPQQPKS